jgi:hypothetical protein
LHATRNFDQLPKILRGMGASGDYRQHAEAVSFFKVGAGFSVWLWNQIISSWVAKVLVGLLFGA